MTAITTKLRPLGTQTDEYLGLSSEKHPPLYYPGTTFDSCSPPKHNIPRSLVRLLRGSRFGNFPSGQVSTGGRLDIPCARLGDDFRETVGRVHCLYYVELR